MPDWHFNGEQIMRIRYATGGIRNLRAYVGQIPDHACLEQALAKRRSAFLVGLKGADFMERETGIEPATFSLGNRL